MSEFSYRNPQTGERIDTGDDDDLRAKGWQRWDPEADDTGRFANLAAVKRANKRIGHTWFDQSHGAAQATTLIDGRYWIEHVRSLTEDGQRDYMAVGVSPYGNIQYLHNAERFATQQQAQDVIDSITG